MRVLFLAGLAGLADAELQYGLVFDAGSSGTRVHVYTWQSGGEHGPFDLVSDDLLKIKPGACTGGPC
jgi:apyrase/ectonucleoside triphosphate diphosphohydrolase 5/6